MSPANAWISCEPKRKETVRERSSSSPGLPLSLIRANSFVRVSRSATNH